MRSVVLSKSAHKFLAGLDRGLRERILDKIDRLASDPQALAGQIKPLKGAAGMFRLRVGGYRVIFTEDGVVVLILKIGHRREVYR
jgi:mRNA interferase RelE/StbE